jgi:hypothetical protein
MLYRLISKLDAKANLSAAEIWQRATLYATLSANDSGAAERLEMILQMQGIPLPLK